MVMLLKKIIQLLLMLAFVFVAPAQGYPHLSFHSYSQPQRTSPQFYITVTPVKSRHAQYQHIQAQRVIAQMQQEEQRQQELQKEQARAQEQQYELKKRPAEEEAQKQHEQKLLAQQNAPRLCVTESAVAAFSSSPQRTPGSADGVIDNRYYQRLEAFAQTVASHES